jgi:hypothetical protein
MILNGLAREARNREKVGAYGGPARYQLGVYDSIQNEWAIYRQFGWYRRSVEAFVPIFRDEGFFVCLIVVKKGV